MEFFRINKWIYRGEGNLNIAISLVDEGKIIRISKINNDERRDAKSLNEATTCPRQLAAFIKDAVAPLVGRTFVHVGEVVELSGEDVKYLNEELNSSRPGFRKHRHLPETACLAICMPDYCSRHVLTTRYSRIKILGPVLTVEIKPKMGFLNDFPLSSLTTAHQVIMASVCKYHLMQHWKLKEGRINRVSDYCPLDLFSGCWHRMLGALRALLKNPQNNLRIFKDGQIIFGENIDGSLTDALEDVFVGSPLNGVEDRLCHLLCQALLRDHAVDDVDRQDLWKSRKSKTPTSTCKYKDIFGVCEVVKNVDNSGCMLPDETCKLPQGCILNRLLTAQMMSCCDAETLLSSYNEFLRHLEGQSPERVHRLLYGPRDRSEVIPGMTLGTFDQVVQKIRDYLFSRTASDCSIMVTMTRFEPDMESSQYSDWIIQDSTATNASQFVHSVVLLDTDCKPHVKLPKHAQEELKMVEHFLKVDNKVSEWTSEHLGHQK